MSKISGKTRYESFMEWHKWAKTKYPIMNVKKKKTPTPVWMGNLDDEY